MGQRRNRYRDWLVLKDDGDSRKEYKSNTVDFHGGVSRIKRQLISLLCIFFRNRNGLLFLRVMFEMCTV